MLGAVQHVQLGRQGAAEGRPLVAHQAVEVPLRGLHRSGLGSAAAKVHFDVVVGDAEDEVQAVHRVGLQFQFGAVGLSVRIGGDGVQADDLEGLVVLVVVVVGRSVQHHQAVQLAGLEADLKGVQLFRVVAHGGVVIAQRRVQREDGRVVAAALHAPVPTGVQQQVLMHLVVQRRPHGELIVLAFAAVGSQLGQDVRVAVALHRAGDEIDHVDQVLMVLLVPNPAGAEGAGQLIAQAALHLAEDGPGLGVGLIGVVQAGHRRGVAGRVYEGLRLRAVGVFHGKVQIVQAGHPIHVFGGPVQANLLGELLRIRGEEEVEHRHRGGVRVLNVVPLDGGVVRDGGEGETLQIPLDGGRIALRLEIVEAVLVVVPGIDVAVVVDVAEHRVDQVRRQHTVFGGADVLEEAGVDVLLRLAGVQQQGKGVRRLEQQLDAPRPVVGVVEALVEQAVLDVAVVVVGG